MIKSITITNHLDESITLTMTNPEESGFAVRYIDGLGPPKANVEMTEMSLMDGAVYNSARAQSRNIVIGLTFLGTSLVIPPSPTGLSGDTAGGIGGSEIAPGPTAEEPDPTPNIETTRQKTYKYFPLKKRVKLVIETDNRSCEVYGYVESNDPDIFSKEGGSVISILCPYSYLLSTEINTTVFATIDPVFEFPFSNESTTLKLLEFSVINGYITRTIYYTGDSEIGMVMTIHAIGDVENVEIFKLEPEPVESIKIDTDKLLAMTGNGFHSGDDIIISTVKGNKYAILVRNGEETNILNCLDKYPDWIQLSRGDNIFTYTAEAGINNLQFKIQNQIAYEGI